MSHERSSDVPTDVERTADAVDHSEIRRLLDTYADVVTRRQWDDIDPLFLPSAPLVLDLRHTVRVLHGPREIATFLAPAVERFEFFQFQILGMVIRLRPNGNSDAATGRTYMSELRQDAEGHQWSQIYGVYHDEFQRTSGGWRFARRHYHSMARRFEGTASAEVFDAPLHIDLDTLSSVPLPDIDS